MVSPSCSRYFSPDISISASPSHNTSASNGAVCSLTLLLC
jgi:hypothetical protein